MGNKQEEHGWSSTSITEESGLCPHQDKAIQDDAECYGKTTADMFRRVKIVTISKRDTKKDTE